MHDPAASALGGIVITVAVLFLLFIALRAVMLWYWKINAIVERLDNIVLLLKKQISPNASDTDLATVPCPSCKKPVLVSDKYCRDCGLGIKRP